MTAHGKPPRFGISAALTTAYRADLSVDTDLMASHARALLDEGCASVTLFGTTGEGTSLSEHERNDVIAALAAEGVLPERMVVAVSSPAFETAIDMARDALKAGVRYLLVPPPFYFKGVSEEGVRDWFDRLFGAIASGNPRVILYHIPQVTGVGVPVETVRAMKDRYGDLVYGVKDSAGNWEVTQGYLAEKDLAVMVGDERHLAAAARLGASGSISGLANLMPARLVRMIDTGEDDPELNALVDAIVALPVTPAVKALVAAHRGEQEWARVRPPLLPTPATPAEALVRRLRDMGIARAA